MCDIGINYDASKTKDISLKMLLKCVCQVSKTNIYAIKGKKKNRELAEARHAYIILADTELHANHDSIVYEINKDRCTVFHARKNKDIPAIKKIVETVKELYL